LTAIRSFVDVALPLCAVKVTAAFRVLNFDCALLKHRSNLDSSGPPVPPSSDIVKLLTGRSGTSLTVERMYLPLRIVLAIRIFALTRPRRSATSPGRNATPACSTA
jgi:hypothetical protein